MSPRVDSTPGFGLGSEEVKRRHILPKALLVGILAGLLAAAFRVALEVAEYWRLAFQADLPRWAALVVGLVIGTIGGGTSVWLVRRFAPEASGSGIPQLKSAILGGIEPSWRRILPVKFAAGALGIGGGLALGREGPTVQMGGATGVMVSQWFGVPKGGREQRALVSAGAGAGLAAAFNAPLAGVIFVLEELQRDFTPVTFVATFIAAVAADVVGRVLLGESPVFRFHSMVAPTVTSVPLALVVGVFSGLGGIAFNRTLLASLDRFERLRTWPPFAVGALAGGAVGLASWLHPGVGGGGSSYVEHALVGSMATNTILSLLVLRFALTMVSYGSGAAGGIFAPLLVLGALGGLAIARGAHALEPAWVAEPQVFAVIGMGALFTAIVRAPLTGIVLMVELTGEYGFMLPLLASCLVAYGVAEYLGDIPIYEALRERAESTSGNDHQLDG